MERLTGRLAEARRALASFEELARRRERSMIERDAAIMRFAYTFEAAWKAVQLYLYEHEGLEVGSPKQSIRASRAIGLLTDDQAESALSMTDDRNLVVHVYRERDDTIRLISARKATRSERTQYGARWEP